MAACDEASVGPAGADRAAPATTRLAGRRLEAEQQLLSLTRASTFSPRIAVTNPVVPTGTPLTVMPGSNIPFAITPPRLMSTGRCGESVRHSASNLAGDISAWQASLTLPMNSSMTSYKPRCSPCGPGSPYAYMSSACAMTPPPPPWRRASNHSRCGCRAAADRTGRCGSP